MISVIATVLNEANNIHHLLDSLKKQTRPADEIIIVDGGSSDGTLNILQRAQANLPLIVISRPGCNISEGRNAAIEAARGEIILATDAGLFLSPHWIEALEAPFLRDPAIELVGGFFEADGHSTFEIAMGACVSRLLDEIDPQTFLPGSRSIAYCKSLWTKSGGYPEWLDFGEDMVFILTIKPMAKRLAFAPDAIVYFRPRSSLRAFFKQYYLYSRGDGKADLWRKRHAIRYATYGMIVPAIFWLGLSIHPFLWFLYAIGGAFYLLQPYRRLAAALRKAQIVDPLVVFLAAAWLPIIRITGDLAKMTGYPPGVLWRWQHRSTIDQTLALEE